MVRGSSKQMIAEWNSMNKKYQTLLERFIPIGLRSDSELEKDYAIRLVMYDFPQTIEKPGSKRLLLDFLARFSRLSDRGTFELHLDRKQQRHVGSVLFSMFKEEGKAVVVTYDFKDMPVGYAFRAIVAADPDNSVKYDYRFGGQEEYPLYRRNFIDLKLAQEVARQYLKEGTRSDKVLWDEFLW